MVQRGHVIEMKDGSDRVPRGQRFEENRIFYRNASAFIFHLPVTRRSGDSQASGSSTKQADRPEAGDKMTANFNLISRRNGESCAARSGSDTPSPLYRTPLRPSPCRGGYREHEAPPSGYGVKSITEVRKRWLAIRCTLNGRYSLRMAINASGDKRENL